MPAVKSYEDSCQTAEAVIARAAEVRKRRAAGYVVPAPVRWSPPIVVNEAPARVSMSWGAPEFSYICDIKLAEIVPGEAPFKNTTAGIQQAICQAFNVRMADLKSARRTADVVLPRQCAMALCARLTLLSLPAIGRIFGGRDHTTVLHAKNKLKPVMDRIGALMSEKSTDADWARALARTFQDMTPKGVKDFLARVHKDAAPPAAEQAAA